MSPWHLRRATECSQSGRPNSYGAVGSDRGARRPGTQWGANQHGTALRRKRTAPRPRQILRRACLQKRVARDQTDQSTTRGPWRRKEIASAQPLRGSTPRCGRSGHNRTGIRSSRRSSMLRALMQPSRRRRVGGRRGRALTARPQRMGEGCVRAIDKVCRQVSDLSTVGNQQHRLAAARST